MEKENNISKIKELIKNECYNLGKIDKWFYEKHLLAVEKFAKDILDKLPEANKEIVLIGVWLHDLQRVRGLEGEHQEIGAIEAEKVMKEYKYSDDMINRVKEIILSHSCNNVLPNTLEGKILATADAMSHYSNDFYLQIALLGEKNVDEFKKWALEKINRDFNKKIMFDFAKDAVRKQHETMKAFLKIL